MTPPSPPLPQHLHIVALETVYCGPLQLHVPPPHTCTVVQYERTSRTLQGQAELVERIRDAHIIVMTTTPLPADLLADPTVAPRLRLIVVQASGVDAVDLDTCALRGIRVVNSPASNVDAVAEHAVTLYFASRRRLRPSMRTLLGGAWPGRGTLMHTVSGPVTPETWPLSCRDETAVIVGYGGVGRRAHALLAGLGMRVVVAARKGAEADGAARTAFAEALRLATVLVLCCPRTPETVGLIGAAELATLPPQALLINVSRGGVVDEQALLDALRAGHLAGAGVDVFSTEPATPETSPLLAALVAEEARERAARAEGADDREEKLNLVVTPHTAWIAAATVSNIRRVAQENITGFLTGSLVAERIRV